MAKINLLPWRAERRKQRQKEFYGMLGIAAGIAVLIAFGVIKFYDARIENQNARNGRLKQEITALDAAIKEIQALDKKKAELLARKAVIEQLQANRSQMVHLFDELVRTIPEGVRLNAIKQTGDDLTLTGVAQSNARVASYMRALEGSGWMASPDVSIIEAQARGDGAMPFGFSLRVKLIKPKDESEGADGTAPVAGTTGGAP